MVYTWHIKGIWTCHPYGRYIPCQNLMGYAVISPYVLSEKEISTVTESPPVHVDLWLATFTSSQKGIIGNLFVQTKQKALQSPFQKVHWFLVRNTQHSWDFALERRYWIGKFCCIIVKKHCHVLRSNHFLLQVD